MPARHRPALLMVLTLSMVISRIHAQQVASGYSNRCGSSWTSANSLCGKPCAYDSDCVSASNLHPTGLSCFDALDTRVCEGGVIWNASLSTGATITVVLGALFTALAILALLFRFRVKVAKVFGFRIKGGHDRAYISLTDRDQFHTARQ
ncbi:hypothetical protein BC830DRAFT_1127898 [Chytriomyces sp. MP71]|nr:hypothetical protein BC830DRAFT_1127898 [Chytriomyces sp. MP71]